MITSSGVASAFASGDLAEAGLVDLADDRARLGDVEIDGHRGVDERVDARGHGTVGRDALQMQDLHARRRRFGGRPLDALSHAVRSGNASRPARVASACIRRTSSRVTSIGRRDGW
jgi:hypothetical protein